MRKNPSGSRFFAYFATPSGRQVIYRGACCTTLGLFLANFIPETVGLQYLKEFVQSYENGVERNVSQKIHERLNKAFDKLEVSSYERLLIKPFTVFGFDLFQAGSTKYRFGCALGIPGNFSLEKISDIDKQTIRFRNEPINWNSEAGKLLQESIVLTEDEQIFGLSKALLQLQTHRVLLNSIFPSISFLTVYTIGNSLNQKMNLFARPLSVRMVMYTILGLFGVGMWSFMKDYNQVMYDAEFDKKLASFGPEFVQAGLGYYDKLLKKNIALRILIDDNTYTAKGNENYLFRQKSLPLTIRKSFFQQQLEELQTKTEDTTSVPQ